MPRSPSPQKLRHLPDPPKPPRSQCNLPDPNATSQTLSAPPKPFATLPNPPKPSPTLPNPPPSRYVNREREDIPGELMESSEAALEAAVKGLPKDPKARGRGV